MPSFCRHGRLQANCPICSKAAAPAAPSRPARPARVPRSSSGPRTPKASSTVKVRRVERAPDDGYDNGLLYGLRSSVDAARMADELAYSVARLEQLQTDPPGLYAEAAGDPRLLFLIAHVGPGRGGDPWSAIEEARRGEPDATVEAFDVWCARHGGDPVTALTGDADWEPGRRFARTFERLTLPGFARGPKYDFLVTAGALGVAPLEAGTLAIGKDALDPVVVTAKRVLGIGDAINIERRASELARGTGVPFAALDLAFRNFSRPEDERATMGATVAADPERRAAIGRALGV